MRHKSRMEALAGDLGWSSGSIWEKTDTCGPKSARLEHPT